MIGEIGQLQWTSRNLLYIRGSYGHYFYHSTYQYSSAPFLKYCTLSHLVAMSRNHTLNGYTKIKAIQFVCCVFYNLTCQEYTLLGVVWNMRKWKECNKLFWTKTTTTFWEYNTFKMILPFIHFDSFWSLLCFVALSPCCTVWLKILYIAAFTVTLHRIDLIRKVSSDVGQKKGLYRKESWAPNLRVIKSFIVLHCRTPHYITNYTLRF